MSLFNRTENRVPVWFMRQAGRYHQHYQDIRKNHRFIDMCKTPDLACEITLGPIQDFSFDAAILFSDLLFPLEHLGMGLSYDAGPPQLKFHLENHADLSKLAPIQDAASFYQFQSQALTLLREKLPKNVDLLGFVGAPFTLFTYACCGSHSGSLQPAKIGLYDERFSKFWEILYPSLLEEMRQQAMASPDALCLFDTAAGELNLEDYKTFIVPTLGQLLNSIKLEFPDLKIVYYSRNTQANYFKALEQLPIDVIGIDWRNSLPETLEQFSDRFYIQGQLDPCWLFLPWSTLHLHLKSLKKSMLPLKHHWKKWIFGLGHGVLPQTPEDNVRKTVEWVKENLHY